MKTYAYTSAALLVVAIIGTAIAQERPAVPDSAAGNPGALSPTPPSGHDLIRETKLKVLRRHCEVNLRNPGQMEDVLSNVLMRAEHKPESEVQAFLKGAHNNYATGDDLLKAAAEHFKVDQKRLAALVEHWRHINCKHAAIPGYAAPDAAREASAGVAEPKPQPPAASQCKVDLRKTVQMANIISNVLMRAEHKPESEVAAFREDAKRRYATGDDVLKAAAEHFKIDQKKLAALVDHWRHINCKHAAIPGYATPDAAREASAGVAEPKPQPPAASQCKVDLGKTLQMANIISNVLMRAEHKPEPEVAAFREDAKRRYARGEDVLKAAAEHFKIDQKKLAALVDHWRHINCKHAAIPGYAVPDAARDGSGCR